MSDDFEKNLRQHLHNVVAGFTITRVEPVRVTSEMPTTLQPRSSKSFAA